jgi:PEP-CTERM motif
MKLLASARTRKTAMHSLAAAFAVIVLPLAAGFSTPASAEITNCVSPADCGVTYRVGGNIIGATNWVVGTNGRLTLNTAPLLALPGWTTRPGGGLSWSNATLANPTPTLSLDIVTNRAQADPEITFGYALDNDTASAVAFSANQFLPINGLTGQIATHSELTIGVTPASSVPAGSVGPTSGGGFIVDSQDIRSLPFTSLDKQVDIGGPCTKVTTGSCVEPEKNGLITLDGSYDTMNVNIGFQVSANTVGTVNGLVSQNVVPEPSTYAMLFAGMAFVGFVARRRTKV